MKSYKSIFEESIQFIKEGKIRIGEKQIKEKIRLSEPQFYIYYLYGRYCFFNKNYLEALIYFEKAINISSTCNRRYSSVFFIHYIYCLLYLELNEKACEISNKAVFLYPQNKKIILLHNILMFVQTKKIIFINELFKL